MKMEAGGEEGKPQRRRGRWEQAEIKVDDT